MGTQGKKNKPITARVSTGLFNKKKGVTEPLLNVGQAGVHGNNQTRDIPSPSKIKGYAMKASPFKQKKDPTPSPYSDEKEIQTNTTTKSAGTQITTPGPELTRTTTAADVGVSQDEVNDYNMKTYGTLNPTKDGKTNNITPSGERGPSTVTDIPGETKTKLGDLEVKGRRGAVQRWESKSQGRNMKTLSDDISDSQKKIGKYTDRLAGHSDKDGKALKGHERRFRNATANLAESTRNMSASQGQYDTYTRQVAAGAKGSSGDTFGVKTKATLSDLGSLENQDKYNADGKIGEPEVQTNVAPVPVVGRDGKPVVAKKDKKVVKDVKTTNFKKTPDFFKKKSPLKMKYFK